MIIIILYSNIVVWGSVWASLWNIPRIPCWSISVIWQFKPDPRTSGTSIFTKYLIGQKLGGRMCRKWSRKGLSAEILAYKVSHFGCLYYKMRAPSPSLTWRFNFCFLSPPNHLRSQHFVDLLQTIGEVSAIYLVIIISFEFLKNVKGAIE